MIVYKNTEVKIDPAGNKQFYPINKYNEICLTQKFLMGL